jgi:hypothetical protein
MHALQMLKKVIILYLTFFNNRKQSGEKHVTNYNTYINFWKVYY